MFQFQVTMKDLFLNYKFSFYMLSFNLFIKQVYFGILIQIRETFEGADIWPDGQEHLPLAEIFLAIGFFLIYFIEEFVHTTCDSKLHGHNHEEPQCEELKCEVQCEEQREQSLAVHR